MMLNRRWLALRRRRRTSPQRQLPQRQLPQRQTFWATVAILCVAFGAVLAPAAGAQTRSSAGRDAGKYRSLIGRSYDARSTPPGLRGWETIGGGAVNEDELAETQVEYVVTGWVKGSAYVVVFQTRPLASKNATIVDVISLTKIPTTQFVALSCSRFGESASHYVALAVRGTDATTTQLRRAWYVDRDRLRFTRIATTGLECETDGP
jgi:hypothetical protein